MEHLGDKLFIELFLTAIALLLVILYNNINLYKIKISDLITQIVIFTMIMCVGDQLADIVQGASGMKWLCYTSVCASTVSSLAMGAVLLRYVMKRLGMDMKYKWQEIVLFYIPNIAMFIICASTPWTKLIYFVDENNIIQSMTMYNMYVVLLAAYTVSAFAIAFVVMLRSSKNEADKRHAAQTMMIFAGLVFVMQIIQPLLLGFDSDYLMSGLAWTVALVYLTTNMSVDTLIKDRTREAAIRADLDIAARIQTGAMPEVFPPYANHPEIDLYASMDTAKEVGGDFYDCFEIDDSRVCFVMADVSGKGVPAALFMMTAKTMIKDYAILKSSTAEIFTEVNKHLSENNDTGMFATAWIGIIDTETMTLQYTNAGHNYPYLAHDGEEFAELKKNHGLFLAGMDDTEYGETELRLQKGDSLFLFTDGLSEAHNNKEELYGSKRLNELLNGAPDRGGRTILPAIRRSVDEFANGRAQFDDITMMMINIK